MDVHTFDQVAAYDRDYADRTLREHGEFAPVVAGYFDPRKPWIYLFPPHMGRDPLVFAAFTLIVGMGMDQITLLHDSYVSTSTTKTDGSEWGQNEMAYAVEHNTVDAKLVSDAIIYMVFQRDGTTRAMEMPYTKRRKGRHYKIKWGESKEYAKDAKFGGVVGDSIAEFFGRKTVTATMRGEETPEELREWAAEHPEAALAYQFCAVAKYALLPRGVNFALVDPHPEALATMEESLKDFPGVVTRTIKPGEGS